MSVLKRQVSIVEVVQSDDIDTLKEYLTSIQRRIEEVESGSVSSVSNAESVKTGVSSLGNGANDADDERRNVSDEVIVIEEGVNITDKVIASILKNADKINNASVESSGKDRLISATESEKDFLNAEKYINENEEILTEEKYVKEDLEKERDAKTLAEEGEKVDIKETKFVKDTTKNTLLRNSLMELSTGVNCLHNIQISHFYPSPLPLHHTVFSLLNILCYVHAFIPPTTGLDSSLILTL